MPSKLEEAHAALDRACFPYQMGPKTPKQLIDEAHQALEDAIRAAKDEEAEEAAIDLEESIPHREFINTEDIWTAKVLQFAAERVRSRIAARGKG